MTLNTQTTASYLWKKITMGNARKTRKIRHINKNEGTQDTMGQGATPSTHRKRAQRRNAPTTRPEQIQPREIYTSQQIHMARKLDKAVKQESENNNYMETLGPGDIPKHCIRPQDQDHALELTDTKHNDIWTSHEGPSKNA